MWLLFGHQRCARVVAGILAASVLRAQGAGRRAGRLRADETSHSSQLHQQSLLNRISYSSIMLNHSMMCVALCRYLVEGAAQSSA